MDPVTSFLIPAVLGGLVIALLMARLHGWPSHDAFGKEGLSTDVINMARIRVAGVGGLGLVAMALAVAWSLPALRQGIAAALVLGTVLGLFLIVRSRRRGPMPSSGKRSGANVVLSIDAPATPDEDGREASDRNRSPPPVAISPDTRPHPVR